MRQASAASMRMENEHMLCTQQNNKDGNSGCTFSPRCCFSLARTANHGFCAPCPYSNITGYIHKHTRTPSRASVKSHNEACNYARNVTGNSLFHWPWATICFRGVARPAVSTGCFAVGQVRSRHHQPRTLWTLNIFQPLLKLRAFFAHPQGRAVSLAAKICGIPKKAFAQARRGQLLRGCPWVTSYDLSQSQFICKFHFRFKKY